MSATFSILYVIVFIIVLCQRWCGVDDCVVLDVEGVGLWNFEAPLPPAAAASSIISSCPYDVNDLVYLHVGHHVHLHFGHHVGHHNICIFKFFKMVWQIIQKWGGRWYKYGVAKDRKEGWQMIQNMGWQMSEWQLKFNLWEIGAEPHSQNIAHVVKGRKMRTVLRCFVFLLSTGPYGQMKLIYIFLVGASEPLLV